MTTENIEKAFITNMNDLLDRYTETMTEEQAVIKLFGKCPNLFCFTVTRLIKDGSK